MDNVNGNLLINDPFRLKSKRVVAELTFYISKRKHTKTEITNRYNNNVRLNDQIRLVRLA